MWNALHLFGVSMETFRCVYVTFILQRQHGVTANFCEVALVFSSLVALISKSRVVSRSLTAYIVLDNKQNQGVARYACEASLGKGRYVGLNDWKTRRSVC